MAGETSQSMSLQRTVNVSDCIVSISMSLQEQ